MGDDIHTHPGICDDTVVTPNQAMHVTAAMFGLCMN